MITCDPYPLPPDPPAPPGGFGFNHAFLAALGAWQNGWSQDPDRRLPIAIALEVATANLHPRFRRCEATCYRKRFLYVVQDNRELVPLFVHGALDENSATSWTTDREIAKDLWGLWRPDAVTGAIFEHVPAPEEVILNIPVLWECKEFVAAANTYRLAGGQHAEAIFHFREVKDQREVVLRAPLRLDEIIALSGQGSVFDDVCAQAKITDPEARDKAWRDLVAQGIHPEEPTYVFDDNARNVIRNTVEKMRTRLLNASAV